MQDKHKKIMRKIFPIPQRYVTSIIMFVTTLIVYELRLTFDTVITEMVKITPLNETFYTPKQKISYVLKFDWSQETQNLLLSSATWGITGSYLTSGILADKYGGKHLINLGLLSISIATLLIPLAAKSGVPWLITDIVFLGFSEGLVNPPIAVLIARWIPLEERGFIAGAIFAAASVGQFISNLLIGLILNIYDGNWEMVYYISGGIGLLWLAISGALIYSEPKVHPFITDEELIFLTKNIAPRTKTIAPWKKIFKSLPVWAYVISNIAQTWSSIIGMTYFPSYCKKILKFSVAQDSIIFSLPSLALFLSAMIFGWVVDVTIRRQWLSVTNTRKLFATVSHAGNAIALLLASYSGSDQVPAVVFFTLSSIFLSAFYASTRVNVIDLSPAFAGSLLSYTSVPVGVVLVVIPYLAGYLTPNFTVNEWNTVFWITGGLQITANIIYVVFGSGEIQPWNTYVPTD